MSDKRHTHKLNVALVLTDEFEMVKSANRYASSRKSRSASMSESASESRAPVLDWQELSKSVSPIRSLITRVKSQRIDFWKQKKQGELSQVIG